mgnify:CR=1 FL=1
MGQHIEHISDASNEITNRILNRSSLIFNIVLIGIFILALILFIYIFRDDKKKYTQSYILRKLLFIKRNT